MEDRLVNKLISAVEVRPGLWDSRLPLGARDKITRAALWQQVVMELGGASGYATVDEVKRKFKSLRDRFIREKNSTDIGAIKRKSWIHLHKLQFLNGTVEHEPAESIILFKNEVDIPMDHAYGLPDETLNTELGSEAPVPKKKKKNSDVNLLILKGTPKGEEKPINPTDSEESFVTYLAQLLAKIPPEEKLEYQMELIAVLQRPLPSQRQVTVTKEEGLVDSLISAVEKRPGLWDTRLPLVARDRSVKANLWQEVVNELGGVSTTDEVKRKFKNLRDKYIKEKTLIEGGALKSRPWIHFQKLQFLNETLYYAPVESFTSNGDETDVPVDQAYGIPEEPESEVDNERHISKKTKKLSDPNLLFFEEIPHIGVPNTTTTSDESFMAYLAQLLAKIPPEEKLEYKLELINVLQRPLASQRQNTGS